MLKKTTLLISVLFIFVLCLNMVSAHDNTTKNNMVSIEQPSNVDVLSDDSTGNFTELDQLITDNDGVINLDKNYKYVSGDTVSSTGITINKTITINGNGHTIDASNLVRIFSVSASNVILNNITFINGYRNDATGGAIYADDVSDYLNISNCNFFNNNAKYAGAVYINSKYSTVEYCNFSDNTAVQSGGALYISGSNNLVKQTVFDNNIAQNYNGGAIQIPGSYNTIDGCNFTKSNAYNAGGALSVSGERTTVKNSNFDSSIAAGGGSIFFFRYAYYPTVDNCTFSNDYCYSWGGSIYFYGPYATLNNSKFISNYARTAGGAVYTDDSRMKIDNCEFINNSAGIGGGALAMFGSYASVTNSNFTGNNASSHGGSIYAKSRYSTIDNVTVANSNAASGGGIYYVYDETNTAYNSYSTISNSRFVNNTARYGGGGLTVTDHTTVKDSNFTENSAGSYGGAIDTTNAVLKNLILDDNSAFYGGAIFSYNSDISNSSFKDNNGTIANSIYVLNKTNIVDCDVLDEDIIIYGNDTRGTVLGRNERDHDIANLMSTSSGYYAYCAERYNLSPYAGIHDSSMEKLKNSINHQPVADYLKILIYLYVDHMQDLKNHDFHNYVWEFTDYEYWNSNDPIVKEVIALYDTGFRVPTEHACKVLSNGTLMYFNFSSMITPSGQQNLFLFKFWYGDQINETLTKEALNKTAFIGDTIEFRIVVSNKGKSPIYDIFVEDNDYSKGLVYENWTAETGSWTYNNKTKQWRLDELLPAKSASILLFFRVMVNGTLYNNATSGVGNINITNATNGTKVYNPNFTVEKITLNKTVELGELVEFEIIIRNTGDIELTDLFVEENSYDGLEYVDYHKDDLWSYSKVNGKHRWTFKGALPIDEVTGFTVIFNTTAYGNFTNIVVTGSNETDNKTANNTTKVLKPNLSVEKKALTPYVYVGNETTFEIVVKNTGEIDLDDVVVTENPQTGLEFVRADTGSIWQETEINGKKAWKLLLTLTPGSEEILFVTFKSNRVGNYTNIVIASSNKTGNKTSNNTTIFNETVPDLPEDTANFTISKITINETVLIGELVTFEIVVKNTGNKKLHNVTVYETKYDDLKYVGYTDHFKMWIFDNDKMSWTLNSTFYPGEEVGFFVTFNTTSQGRYMNTIVVSSNETDNKTTNNTTKVLKPGLDVEKIVINKTVVNGEQVMFEILVHNNGEEILDKVIVREISFDGLIYDHFEDYSHYWTKNDDLSWSLNKKLYPDEYEGFFVIFNTTRKGSFTNTVVVESNDTDNDTDNDTVVVLDYNITVSKITLTPIVKVGQNAIFEIVVLNNGDLDLKNVFVVEDKYDSGLVYINYNSVNGKWKHSLNSDNKHVFTLDDLLKVGESASFRVIFKTTKLGNFTNTVIAGYNNTTVANSTNITEVYNITHVPNSINSTDVNKTTDNSANTTSVSDKIKIHKIDEKATGNPLFVLLLVLALIPIRRFFN